jgi:DNA-binding CsgD family transcriptional regulator
MVAVHPELVGALIGALDGTGDVAASVGPRAPSGSDGALPPGQPLTPRELEVLALLAEGQGNKQIAGRLRISEHTVKFHVASVFEKLGAGTRAEAVAIGVRRGVVML